MKMAALGLFGFVVASGLFAPGICQAEILLVPSYGAPPVNSSPLDAGKLYLIEARGTFVYDSQGSMAAPEWVHDAFGAYGPGIDGWVENAEAPAHPDELDLSVNGAVVDWLGTPDTTVTDQSVWSAHTYSPTHVYRLSWYGEGQPITFRIEDGPSFTSRNLLNAGDLVVEIIPEPATLSLLAISGLVLLRRRLHS